MSNVHSISAVICVLHWNRAVLDSNRSHRSRIKLPGHWCGNLKNALIRVKTWVKVLRWPWEAIVQDGDEYASQSRAEHSATRTADCGLSRDTRTGIALEVEGAACQVTVACLSVFPNRQPALVPPPKSRIDSIAGAGLSAQYSQHGESIFHRVRLFQLLTIVQLTRLNQELFLNCDASGLPIQ